MTNIEKLLGVLLIFSIIAMLIMAKSYKIRNEEYEKERKELLKDIKDANKRYEDSKKKAAIFKLKWEHADSLLKDPKQYDNVRKNYVQTIDSIDNAHWNELLNLWSR